MSFGADAFAYYKHSVRYNILNCTACHWSPVGGGPKNINGKLFGAHGYEVNPLFANQDYLSVDFRALYYYPERPRESKGGLGIMSASVAGHVALDKARRIQLVIEHNLAGFSAAQFRDTYALFRLSPESDPSWFDTLMIGRFRAPFGITTDEHRTYTRVLTNTPWFTFETGAMLSGTPAESVHYDLAMVNGEKSTGDSLQRGNARRWGTILNLRWMPNAVLYGVSGSYHEHRPTTDSRYALSAYSVVSVSRITNDEIPVSIYVEHARGWRWNSVLANGFLKDPAYGNSVKDSSSWGWLGWVQWDLSRRLTLLYKLDLLTPDRNYPSDYFVRHGVGARYWIGPNAMIQTRAELAQATHPSEAGSDAVGAQDAAYAILQLTF